MLNFNQRDFFLATLHPPLNFSLTNNLEEYSVRLCLYEGFCHRTRRNVNSSFMVSTVFLLKEEKRGIPVHVSHSTVSKLHINRKKWHYMNTSLSKNSSWNNCTEPLTSFIFCMAPSWCLWGFIYSLLKLNLLIDFVWF